MCSRFITSMMSLIGFSLNYAFIKIAHIEFSLFKVSHYLHCTLRLLVIYFFFLYWACPLSNLLQVGEPNTPSCFHKHWECQSQVIASRGEDWTNGRFIMSYLLSELCPSNSDFSWRSKSLIISLSCMTLNFSYSVKAFS